MKRIAIFASGTGTNAKKIIEYFSEHKDISVSLIVSNKKKAPVLKYATDGIKNCVIRRQEFNGTIAILKVLEEEKIDFIVLAGFLWLVPSYLIDAFPNKIINIHPSLLPKYGGKGMYGYHVHRAVKLSGDPETGITIHFVNDEYDRGEIIFQAKCPVTLNDDAATISGKVRKLEHKFFPQIIEQVIRTQ